MKASYVACGLAPEGIYNGKPISNEQAFSILLMASELQEYRKKETDGLLVGHSYWIAYSTEVYIGSDDSGNPRFAERKFYCCNNCRKGTVVKAPYSILFNVWIKNVSQYRSEIKNKNGVKIPPLL